jgi:hypothetical protein
MLRRGAMWISELYFINSVINKYPRYHFMAMLGQNIELFSWWLLWILEDDYVFVMKKVNNCLWVVIGQFFLFFSFLFMCDFLLHYIGEVQEQALALGGRNRSVPVSGSFRRFTIGYILPANERKEGVCCHSCGVLVCLLRIAFVERTLLLSSCQCLLLLKDTRQMWCLTFFF